ncbi:putative zinc metalloprotease [Luteitalea sp. TBR-22]|uniref:RIP metalloprotease RseP n=1 Tax=Luteitalea sp. TBR-22 TaxID=2802971 RepID=UPI001AF566F3|nr:RIP metalloprotease RseP [Luteitalea sp. TBR-22]BCS31538.1 putative zinc metalloprotease [Luteitalea sp. TBR-22]
MTNLWAFLFVLGVLVFVHELGHFLLARWNGVRVLTFSLGFGPKLLKVVRGGTEYCISAIPLGGYVKMAGETPDDPRQGAPDEFLSKTKWQRFQILIAGPLMNLLLAVGLMTFVIWNGATEPAYEQRTPVVGRVLPGSPAEKAGIRAGDVILSFADKDVSTWQGLQMRVVPRANREVPIVISRGGQRQQLTVVPEAQTKYEIGDLGISPSVHPEVVQVQPGSAAEAAGLKPKDVILSFNGTDTTGFTLQQMIGEISKRAGQPVTLGILRGGQRLEVPATPRDQGGIGRLGINLSPFETVTIQPGFVQAIGLSVKQNWEWTAMIGEMLAGLFTAETSPKQLMGPLGIAEVAGGAAAISWAALFGTMAMVSLNLGLLNLLPIPILDGGHITILAIEGLARRDFSMRVKERMLMAGFAVLMLLMVTVIYNDLSRVEWLSRLLRRS